MQKFISSRLMNISSSSVRALSSLKTAKISLSSNLFAMTSGEGLLVNHGQQCFAAASTNNLQINVFLVRTARVRGVAP